MGNNKQQILNWAKNPQFFMELKRDTSVFINLSQDDGRFTKKGEFPYEGVIKTACFTLMRLENNEESVKSFDQSRIVKLSVLKLHRTIEIRENLKAGRYVVVPATMKAGETGKFSISIYLNCEKNNADLFLSSDKSKGVIIEEEEEVTREQMTPRLFGAIKELVKDVVSLR